MVHKFKKSTEDPGSRLLMSVFRMTGVSATGVDTVVNEFGTGLGNSRSLSIVAASGANPNANLIAFATHPRGYLESVQITQVSGDAGAWEAFILDKSSENVYQPNVVWRSSTVIAQSTQYPAQYPYGDPSYPGYYLESTTLRTLTAYALGVPYENRQTLGNDSAELYFAIVPVGSSTNNVYHVKLGTIALT